MCGATYFYAIFCGLCLINCTSTQDFATSKGDRRLLKVITTSPTFSNLHTGFALYDPATKNWLCQYNAHKYFTPASNTKILTLLTCLHVLGDSIETMRYVLKGDSLIFRGMGDPSFLFAELPSSTQPLEILRDHPGRVFYQAGAELDHYGPGWAWDDYPYTYQVEKSALPLYGNRVKVTRNREGEVVVLPGYFSDYIETDTTDLSILSRDQVANVFVLNDFLMSFRDTLEIPFIVSDFEITRLLMDTLHRAVDVIYDETLYGDDVPVYGASRDTLLKRMMQVSDNFISEQLLMQCAFYMRGTLESDSAIAVAQQMIMGGVPDSLHWVDGSGLSRYNLFTPRSLVWVLEQLMQLQSMDYLTEIFPAGGRSGTLADWYGADPSYIYAKTGSLRNQHCLSGYVHADSGKLLIFSFMHNNFVCESAEIKKEMEKILLMIKVRM